MKVYSRELRYSTKKSLELIDITRDVERVVEESRIESGMCMVFAPHATAAVMANEAEPGLMQDVIKKVSELFPRGAGYLHDRIDDNAHAHLASSIIGSARVFPVSAGRLVRGTWQNIFLVELDGPRSTRRLVVTIIGD